LLKIITMKNKKEIISISIISICLSLLGSWMDNDIKVSGFGTQVFEIAMMSIIIFVVLSLSYFISIFTYRKIKHLVS